MPLRNAQNSCIILAIAVLHVVCVGDRRNYTNINLFDHTFDIRTRNYSNYNHSFMIIITYLDYSLIF